MMLNVSQLLKEASGSRREYRVDEELASGEGRVVGTVGLMRTDKGVWISAEMSTDVRCSCSRCLKEYSQRIEMAFEEEAFPLDSGDAEERDGAPAIDDSHILDLTDAIDQYLYLAVPINPVCREDCRGICADCGADLNETLCACDHDARDRRWADLLQSAVSDKPDSRVN